ncbi:MAG: hypothetical protein EZS28_049629, partial [Streblomastix strix]
HSLTFENMNCDDKVNFYGNPQANIFAHTTLFDGTKATKTLYPNKYMLTWKLATDDSFMRGYNSSRLGTRSNIQVILYGNLTKGIIDTATHDYNETQNQNNFKEFIATRSYPDPNKSNITPMMHYLRDAIVRITFDDNPDPQVLNIAVIGELNGSSIAPV